jgi:4-amino-4-deoxy-L-arabinose transferase-like glycosyltransferase
MARSPFLFSDHRAHLACVLAIIGASVALRLWLFAGYGGFDDAEYARIGYQIANGTFTSAEYRGPVVFPLRVGQTFPTALAFSAFGLSEWSMVLYPFTLSVLALVVAYFCATHFFGHRAGLIAVALVGVLPMEVSNATKLLPDMPAAFYAALGVTVIAVVGRAGANRKMRFVFLGGALAGIAFGVSWLCKESISFLAPFCLAYLLVCLGRDGRASWVLWSGVAAGSLGVLLGEMVVYWSLTGDPLFRFHEIERNYRLIENGFFTQGSAFGWQEGESYARAVAKRLIVDGPAMLLFQYEFLFIPLIGLVAACHAWYSKDRAFLVPSLWLVGLLLMFNFSSTSVSSYMPAPLFHRYFYMIIFPSVVLAAGFVAKLVERAEGDPHEAWRERRFWGLLMAFVLLMLSAYYVQGALRSSPSSWSAEVRVLSAKIGPSSRLYTDTLSIRGMEFFLKYPSKTQWTDFSEVKSLDEVGAGSIVLVNKAYIEWLNRNAGMWLSPKTGYARHGFYEEPPSSWHQVWLSGNARLYRVE